MHRQTNKQTIKQRNKEDRVEEDRLTPLGRTADGNLNARMVLFWNDDLVDAFKKYLLTEPPLSRNVEWEAYVSRYDTTSRESRG